MKKLSKLLKAFRAVGIFIDSEKWSRRDPTEIAVKPQTFPPRKTSFVVKLNFQLKNSLTKRKEL